MTWPRAAAFDHAQRHHHRVGAIQAGHHVGHRQRRQHRRAVREAVLRSEARHRLDQRAEAGTVAIRSVLTEAGDAHDDQLRIARVQHVRPEPHLLQRAGAVVLDQHLRRRQQVEQYVASCLRPQVQRQALLVPRIDFPVQALALPAPGAQRIADFGVLDLDDLGALVGELQADHVAGDQARQVHHADAGQRHRGVGGKFDTLQHCALSRTR